MSKPLSPLVLLVEDEPAIRSVVADVIEAAGLRSEVASNYADGFVLLHASRPALLIADVRLPDGDGHQLAGAARQLGVPTLLISGHPDEIVVAEVSRSAFLAKPFRLAEMRAAIGALIGRAQSCCVGSWPAPAQASTASTHLASGSVSRGA